MGKVLLTSFFLIISYFLFSQNVGIGTSNPETKLKIEGAVSYKIDTIPAGTSITIPENISIAYIADNGIVSVNNATASNPKEGQVLTIYNTDGQLLYFAGHSIDPVSGVASFVFINGAWRLTAKNSLSWNINGNIGTNPPTNNPLFGQKVNNNYLGTFDNKDLAFVTDGWERMRITRGADAFSGKVGIGTSVPKGKLSIVEEEDVINVPALFIEEKNDGDALEINERGYGSALTINSTDLGFGIFSNLYGPVSFGFSGLIGHSFSDGRTNNISSGNKVGTFIETSGNYIGNSIGLLVNASGGTTNTAAIFKKNVGIGFFETWSVPRTLLDLQTFNLVTNSTTPGMLNIMASETNGLVNGGGSLSFSGFLASTSDFRVWGTVEGRKENDNALSERGYLIFKTNGETALLERMRIDGYGRVGIGTQTPRSRLDIVEPDYASFGSPTSSTFPGMLNIMSNNTGGAADLGGSISLGGYRNTNTEFRVYGTIEGRKSTSVTTSSSGYLVFKTNNAGTLSERMRIFNDGLVRINDLAGSGIRVVTAGADGSLGASSIGILETDPTWSGIANIVGTTGTISRTGSVGIGGTPGSLDKLSVTGNTYTTNITMTGSTFVSGSQVVKVTGPGTSVDNQYHNVVFSSAQTVMTGISIYCTGSYLDGDISIYGTALNDLLTTTSSWFGLNNGSTSAGSGTNTNATNADNQFHRANCPNGRIATGIEIYATNQLDGHMKLRCTTLASGYTTTESGMGIESLINAPYANADDITHMSTCPVGTFVKGIEIYASDRLDNRMRVFCTGIRKN